MSAGLTFTDTLTGLSTTGGYPIWYPDITKNPFTVSVSAVVNSSNIAFTVQHTLDYTGSSTFISSNANWFASSGIAAASTNAFTAYTFPVTAIRLNSTAGSSTSIITMTAVQAG